MQGETTRVSDRLDLDAEKRKKSRLTQIRSLNH